MRSKHRVNFLLVLTFFLGGLTSLAQAQSPNTEPAVREINRSFFERFKDKFRPAPTPPPEISPPPEQEAAEGPRFFVKKIQLTGTESFPPLKFDPILQKFEGREVSFAELNTLTKTITQEYFNHGILATCFIPQQKIEDGLITIQVVEAHMGELRFNDHRYFRQNRIGYYWKLPKGEVIKYSKILESLALINKNPDREAKAIFHKGTEPKSTDVTLDVKTNFPLHFTYGLDNEGVPSTGKMRTNLAGRNNNLLGLDDTLFAGYLFGNNFNGIYTYHSVPLTNFGTSFVYGHSLSKAVPKKEFAASGIHARAREITASIHQDLFYRGQPVGDIHIGIDAKDNSSADNSGTATRDRLRVIRMGFDILTRRPNKATYLITQISQGINGLGAQRLNSFSSRDAENVFTKLEVTFQSRHTLPLDLQGNFQFKGQTASTRLTPQEAFYLGGISSVRGYPSGDFLADDALEVNTDLLIPSFFIPKSIWMPFSKKSLRDNLTFVSFFDYGWGNKRHALSNEKNTANLMSVGAGIRTLIFDKAIFRAEWGFPVGDPSITESGKSRFHFSIDFEF